MLTDTQQFIAIVPAAGVGKRMQANCPKQYLKINEQTIIFHTVTRLLSHPMINKVVIALGENDQYFSDSGLSEHQDIIRVQGGAERVDSVLNGLKTIDAKTTPWVLVHDAARPCVSHQDIDNLIRECRRNQCGGILATPVRDTMKRGMLVKSQNSDIEHQNSARKNNSAKVTLNNSTDNQASAAVNIIEKTVEREQLWHALTPQLYKTAELTAAIEQALAENATITDEASAMEFANYPSILVAGSSENIKITNPSDLALAEFYLNKSLKSSTKAVS